MTVYKCSDSITIVGRRKCKRFIGVEASKDISEEDMADGKDWEFLKYVRGRMGIRDFLYGLDQ